MTHSHFLRSAADQHFKTETLSRRSTFELVTSAAQLTREKAARLRASRMDREDAAAAIHLSDLTTGTRK